MPASTPIRTVETVLPSKDSTPQTPVYARLPNGAQRGVVVIHENRGLTDHIRDVARRVGAVNTFWVDDDGQLVGDNTDVAGFDAQ